MSFPSEVCPDVTRLNNFEANTGDEVFFYDRLCPRVTAPGAQ